MAKCDVISILVGIGLFVAVICPMIYFIIREGTRYGTEIEGGSGGTHNPMTRQPWKDGER